MDRDDKVNGLALALSNFLTEYVEHEDMSNNLIMDALCRLYVTYGFTLKSDKLSNEDLRDLLANWVTVFANIISKEKANAKEA